MAEDSRDLQDDIRRLQETLQKDGNQFYDYIVDSDEDSVDDDEDVLFIDLTKHDSAGHSVASISAHSVGATPSVHSHPSTAETQSMITETEDDGEMFREVGVVWDKLDSNTLPPTIESCLVINRAYQDIISEHISRIEVELAENREAQRRLEEEARDNSIQQNTKKRFPYSMVTPYFKMRGNLAPPANEDVVLKKRADEPDLDMRPESVWSLKHKRILTQAVSEDALEKAMQPLLSRRELEEEKLLNTAENSAESERIKDRIAAIDCEIEEKRNTPQSHLLQNIDPDRVDWMKISNITFQGRRGWLSCRRAWQHSVDPSLNQDPMTDKEEEKLSQLVDETGKRNWVYIAQQLGTGRTAFQGLQYYQQHMNPEMLDRPWVKEEDEQLVRVVQQCQQLHFNWRKVAQFMEGRSGVQCYKRFIKLDPNITKGLWTEAEDGQLMAAVQLLGSCNWGRVSELVLGRTREQCRERYLNSLDPRISGKPWTYEEDKLLVERVEQFGKEVSWVRLTKEFPGRTDNQILQRFKRLEDWRQKAEWFKMLSARDKELLQGNNLPGPIKTHAQTKNWEQFSLQFGVFPEDYRKQEEDMSKGGTFVPRPPFMIGLANKAGSKLWERRIKLHALIESHINKLKEKYTFTTMGQIAGPLNTTVAGVYELQDEIAQLSQECLAQRDRLLAQRDQLLENRVDRLGLLIHNLPSKLVVKDLLAVSRGKQVHEPQRRGRMPHKKRPFIIAPRLHLSMKIDAELRKVARANLKERSLKKGRPRRFFWDLKGDQKLSPEDLNDLKATTISLYMKSLGVDHAKMVKEGRKTFPDLYHKLKAKSTQLHDNRDQTETSHEEEEDKSVRRSKRVAKIKKESDESAEVTDPFSLAGNASNVPFIQWTKQRDYELLEWLAEHQDLEVGYEPPQPVAMDHEIPIAGFIDVRTVFKREADVDEAVVNGVSAALDIESRLPVGHGMSLVHATIQQAMAEIEAAERGQQTTAADSSQSISAENCHEWDEDGGESDQRLLTSGAGDASNAAASMVNSAAHPTSSGDSSAVNPRGFHQTAAFSCSRQIPNLPPTATTVATFRELLLKRLGLIKTAGPYYSLRHYLKKRDDQLAMLIESGKAVKELSRGTMDLNRMMNRISQDTNFHTRKKSQKRSEPPVPQADEPMDRKQFCQIVLEALRKTDDYKLLQSRFQSVFLWPALLSTVYPPFIRADYAQKAGGHDNRCMPEDYPHFQASRRKMALLKSRHFYKFANKSKEEKKVLLKKRQEEKILKQVRDLLADADDPMPEVTLDPDSDDPEVGSSAESSFAAGHAAQPQATTVHSDGSKRGFRTASATAASEDLDNEPQPGPSGVAPTNSPAAVNELPKKKYKKRFVGLAVRHSTRVTEKRTYVDCINNKNLERALHKSNPVAVPMEKQRPRKTRFQRNQMISAMLELQNQKKSVPKRSDHAWHPVSGYVSDDEDTVGEMVEELAEREQAAVWEGLGEEQRQSLVMLEQESIVDGCRAKVPNKNILVSSSPNVDDVLDAGGSGAVSLVESNSSCVIHTSVRKNGSNTSKRDLSGNSSSELPSHQERKAYNAMGDSGSYLHVGAIVSVNGSESSVLSVNGNHRTFGLAEERKKMATAASKSLLADGISAAISEVKNSGMSICAVTKRKSTLGSTAKVLDPRFRNKDAVTSSVVGSPACLEMNGQDKTQSEVSNGSTKVATKRTLKPNMGEPRDPKKPRTISEQNYDAVSFQSDFAADRFESKITRMTSPPNSVTTKSVSCGSVTATFSTSTYSDSVPGADNSAESATDRSDTASKNAGAVSSVPFSVGEKPSAFTVSPVDIKSQLFSLEEPLFSLEESDMAEVVDEPVLALLEDSTKGKVGVKPVFAPPEESSMAARDAKRVLVSRDESGKAEVAVHPSREGTVHASALFATSNASTAAIYTTDVKTNGSINKPITESASSIAPSVDESSSQDTKPNMSTATTLAAAAGLTLPNTSMAATLSAAAVGLTQSSATGASMPMPNMAVASLASLGIIQPSFALAIPSPDQRGLVLFLPNSADPNGPPIQLNIPLQGDPETGAISLPSFSGVLPTLGISSFSVPHAASAGFTVAATSPPVTDFISSSVLFTSPPALNVASPSTSNLDQSPAIKDGVFRRIPAGQAVVELDSDSDSEPSVAKLLSDKRANAKPAS